MKAHKPDIIFIGVISLLALFGLLMLFSASSPMGYATFNDPYFFIKKQLLLGFLPGLIGFYILSKIDYLKWRRLARPFFIFAMILLVLVIIPEVGGGFGTANRWFSIGGQSFQPSELAKLAIIIFLADWLAEFKKENFLDWRKSFLPFLLILSAVGFLLMKEPDMGTFLIIFIIVVGMYFASGAELSHLLIIFASSLVGFVGLIFLSPYRFHRLVSFLNPNADALGISYHINQALLAVGSGGLFGLGWGHSVQKFQYLPQADADSIFAIIAEELGFLISVAFIVLLIYIFWRGLKIAEKSSTRFGRLIVIGVMIWMTGQSFVNISAMVGVLPLTGVPLPLVSHGGGSILVTLLALGLVVNISKYTKEEG